MRPSHRAHLFLLYASDNQRTKRLEADHNALEEVTLARGTMMRTTTRFCQLLEGEKVSRRSDLLTSGPM